MPRPKLMLITGTRKGIGRYLAEYYVGQGYQVVGCSREPVDFELSGYHHICSDITDEKSAINLVREAESHFGTLSAVLNNAGIALMNHTLLTPTHSVESIFKTNVFGLFTIAREAAKSMVRQKFGRIINFATIATPLKLEGEAAYAASKAAVVSLTQVMARELAQFNITVNAVGPTPIATDLIRNVPREKIDSLIAHQSIHRLGQYQDVSNITDFFLSERSNFVTGQTLYLGGVS